jgi:predicted nucleic acid-binding protein
MCLLLERFLKSFSALRNVIIASRAWNSQTGVQMKEPKTTLSRVALGFDLDPGESAALTLAQEIHAHLLLIDEARGRAAAKALGLRVSGVLGVLLHAKNSGILSVMRPILKELEGKAGFWLSPKARDMALRLAREA